MSKSESAPLTKDKRLYGHLRNPSQQSSYNDAVDDTLHECIPECSIYVHEIDMEDSPGPYSPDI